MTWTLPNILTVLRLLAAPGLAVDIIDSLPVPFGLVRYGVAADHQGTKAVTRQFARIFRKNR